MTTKSALSPYFAPNGQFYIDVVSTSATYVDPRIGMKMWRDEIRTRFASLTTVRVSDIFTWDGTSANVKALGFELHDSNFDVSYYFLTGYSNSSSSLDPDQWFQGNSTQIMQYVVRTTSLTSTTMGSSNGIIMLMNPDTSVSRPDMNYDNLAEMTYSSGDFTALTAISPETDAGAQALVPSHAPKGVTIDDSYCTGLLSYESAIGCLNFTYLDGATRNSIIMGNCVIPNNAGTSTYDTHAVIVVAGGTLAANYGHDVGTSNSASFSSVLTFNETQQRTQYTLGYPNDITLADGRDWDPLSPTYGRYNWRRHRISQALDGVSPEKGFVDERILCSVGPTSTTQQGNYGSFGLSVLMPNTDAALVKYYNKISVFQEAGYAIAGVSSLGVPHNPSWSIQGTFSAPPDS